MRQKRRTPANTQRQSDSDKSDSGAPCDNLSEPKPDRYRKLARRITIWSCNFLATCAILILGLTFGSQVLQWWRGEPPIIATNGDESLERLANPQLTHLLEFGERSNTLARVVLEGDRQTALARLRRSCRDIAEGTVYSARKIEGAEERLLQRLKDATPVDEGVGWRIYQHEGPILMVVAVRSPQKESGGTDQRVPGQESVVSWGLGLRQYVATDDEAATPDRWTLLTYSAVGRSADSGPDFSWLVPPGGRRTLSMQVEQGGTLIGLVGEGSLNQWMSFFGSAFQEEGWKCTGSWSEIGTTWHARFQDAENNTCDVQLAVETAGTISGILTVARAVPEAGSDAAAASGASRDAER